LVVDEHNKIRQEYSSSEMVMDEKMNEEAQKHADYLATNDKFEKATFGGKYTCNIAGSSKKNQGEALKDSVQRLADCNDFKKYLNSMIKRIGVGVTWNEISNVWVLVVLYEQPQILRPNSRNF